MRRATTRLVVGAVALSLIACSQPQAKSEPPVPAPVETANQTPEGFVRSLYEAGDAAPADNARFTARTRELIEQTEALTPEGYVGFFEADPICDCQDGTPVLDSLSTVSAGPDRADVAVVQSFAEPGNAVHRKTYRLVREGGQWKIDDMTYQSVGEFPRAPLVQSLTTWIAEVRADPNAFSGE